MTPDDYRDMKIQVAVVLSLLGLVTGFKGGAPPESCVTMTPMHGSNMASIAMSGVNIDVSPRMFNCDSMLTGQFTLTYTYWMGTLPVTREFITRAAEF